MVLLIVSSSTGKPKDLLEYYLYVGHTKGLGGLVQG